LNTLEVSITKLTKEKFEREDSLRQVGTEIDSIEDFLDVHHKVNEEIERTGKTLNEYTTNVISSELS